MSYLMAALAKWNDVSDQTGAGVKFEYQGNTSEELNCEKCLTIMRGDVFDKTRRHVTQLNAFSLHHDQLISYATIIVDRKLTNAKALLKALAHELGHNLGLLDCYSCKQKSTVMNQFKVINKADDMGGPTQCDIAQVKEAYRELKIHVRPSPANRDFDDGEEPVDDDTPIVIPHP
jgi:predicted Zn-dependent protease